MIWLILLLCSVCFIGGYVTCGLLTNYKDDRIRDLEGLLATIFEAKAKDREEAVRLVRHITNLERLDEGTRPRDCTTH